MIFNFILILASAAVGCGLTWLLTPSACDKCRALIGRQARNIADLTAANSTLRSLGESKSTKLNEAWSEIDALRGTVAEQRRELARLVAREELLEANAAKDAARIRELEWVGAPRAIKKTPAKAVRKQPTKRKS